MNQDAVLSLGNYAIETMVLLAAPMLITAMAVGLLIGLFQAATQINETTLSFIPKLLSLVIVLVVTGPWMLNLIVTYTRQLFENIPGMIG